MGNPDFCKLEESLIVSEFQSLREEIQARLSRIFKLHQGLLLGILVYATTFYMPKIVSTTSMVQESKSLHSVFLLYFVFLFILPIITFMMEIICTSEQDAIYRAGIYIRDNIEKKYRQSTFKGWEDWLVRLDTKRRRRSSDKLITDVRRYFIIPIYCLTSSVICTIGVNSLYKLGFSTSNTIVLLLSGFTFYMIFFSLIVKKLDKTQKEEFNTPIYNLFVIDVDGCLLDRNKEISKANIDAINCLYEKGINIMLASGRGSKSLYRICKKLNIKGHHVCCQGASIFDATNNNEIQMPSTLTQYDMDEIIKELNSKSIKWVAFGLNNYYCNKSELDFVKNNLLARKDLIEDELDIIFPIETAHVYKFPEEINKILCFINIHDKLSTTALLKTVSKKYRVMMSTPETLEIIHNKTSKVNTVEKIIDDYGPYKYESLVAGDFDNDIDILKWGRHAVAPSNASANVKELENVDVFKTSNDEDFISDVSNTYFDS